MNKNEFNNISKKNNKIYIDEYLIIETDDKLVIKRDPSRRSIDKSCLFLIFFLTGVLFCIVFLYSVLLALGMFFFGFIIFGLPSLIYYFLYYKHRKYLLSFDKNTKIIMVEKTNPIFKKKRIVKFSDIESLTVVPDYDIASLPYLYLLLKNRDIIKIIKGSLIECEKIGIIISKFLEIPLFKE